MKKGKLILGGIIAVLVLGNIHFCLDRDFFREEYNQAVDEHNKQIEKVFNWEEENLEINEYNISEIERCEKENYKLTDDYNNLLSQKNECVENWEDVLSDYTDCYNKYDELGKEYDKLYAEYEKSFQ